VASIDAATAKRSFLIAYLFALISRVSPLQLPFQLVEKAPLRRLRDDPVGAGLDHSNVVQSQRIKPHGILWVVLAPERVTNLHGLQGIVVAVASVRNHAPG